MTRGSEDRRILVSDGFMLWDDGATCGLIHVWHSTCRCFTPSQNVQPGWKVPPRSVAWPPEPQLLGGRRVNANAAASAQLRIVNDKDVRILRRCGTSIVTLAGRPLRHRLGMVVPSATRAVYVVPESAFRSQHSASGRESIVQLHHARCCGNCVQSRFGARIHGAAPA
jgi:hypothetical protein